MAIGMETRAQAAAARRLTKLDLADRGSETNPQRRRVTNGPASGHYLHLSALPTSSFTRGADYRSRSHHPRPIATVTNFIPTRAARDQRRGAIFTLAYLFTRVSFEEKLEACAPARQALAGVQCRSECPWHQPTMPLDCPEQLVERRRALPPRASSASTVVKLPGEA